MKKDIKWLEITSVYVGTVIGAGFASGQELLQFFGVYGYKGILGILVATVLFAVIGASLLHKVYLNKLNNYQDIIFPVLGRKLGILIEFFMLSYLLIGFCIMLAGSGALFQEQLNMRYDIGLIIMSVLTLITIMYSVRGITIANKILVPLLLIGIIGVGLTVMMKGDISITDVGSTEHLKYDWFMSAILYVSYNIMSAIVVLASLLPAIKNKASAVVSGIMGGVSLGIMSIFILIPMLINYNEVSIVEIPMLKISQYLGDKGNTIYSIMLWIAMFTTAVSNAFGFISRISDITKINSRVMSIIFCIGVIPLAKLGFSNLVSTFYPIFGYIGATFLGIFILLSTYRLIFKNIKKAI